jgi:hypothetical protein
MHQRHDGKPAQHREQETDRQVHDRFDHGPELPELKEKFTKDIAWQAGKKPALPCR